MTSPLVEIEDLHVEFSTHRGRTQAVRGVNLAISAGETVGLVGESGSGKSVTSRAMLGLIQEPGRIVRGDVRWNGESLIHGRRAGELAATIRGRRIGMVFQDPMTSLNPLMRIGDQIGEVLRRHVGMNRKQALARAGELLDLVGIAVPQKRVRQYPHELSGGMRQRVLIAQALACEPELLIADEPTTALDVTTQAQILELIASIQTRMGLAVLLITHDLGVVANLCHRVEVMYGGRMMESAFAEDLFSDPRHPYTAGLIRATPRVDRRVDELWAIPGAPPDPRRPPGGCPFHPRCEHATAECAEVQPDHEVEGQRRFACFHPIRRAIQEADQ